MLDAIIVLRTIGPVSQRQLSSRADRGTRGGYDAVLLNTAIAKATDPVGMAQAFAGAVTAGRIGYEAGLMAPRDMAVPSTPVAGTPFFDLD